ncbi:MAG: 50S ribosomal protein L6 [Simkaniaceae bacterium]|nr:50S ribosomal protein L6 [Candidatus Sacchlamyda saccharinae]
MSRYGNSPIPLPGGVEVKKAGNKVNVKGPKGQLEVDVKDGIEVAVEETQVLVTRDEQSQLPSAMHGLYRSLINNMVVGVEKGFEKRLSLIGVGYRAAVAGNLLDLQLGFSHPTKVEIPQGINVKVEKSTTIIIDGIDKQVVGQFAATVRALRPPEPYKGKGVRYENEYVRKKAGKAAKGK